MSLVTHPINSTALAEVVIGYHHFLRWASKYGKQLIVKSDLHRDFAQFGEACLVELSFVMSASFNFGFDSNQNCPYLVIDAEEFNWLKLLPVSEVIVSQGYLAVIIDQVQFDDVKFEPLIIKLSSPNHEVWKKVSVAKSVGFACLHHSDEDYEVTEVSSDLYPLRCLN